MYLHKQRENKPEQTRQDKTAPFRHIELENGEFKPVEYESHELVKDSYDRDTARGFKRGKYDKRYGRMKPDGAYTADDKDYRGFRKLKQEEIDFIVRKDAEIRALKALMERKFPESQV